MAAPKNRAQRRQTAKGTKAGNAQSASPPVLTIDGKRYEMIPPEQWTAEHDDIADALILRRSSSLEGMNPEDAEARKKAMLDFAADIVASGEHRELLAAVYWPKGEGYDPDRLDENRERFRTARLGKDRLRAVSGVLTAFFTSVAA